MLGSQAKGAATRGMARNLDCTARNAEALAELIRGNLADSTKKFELIEVLVVPVIPRPEERREVAIPSIQAVRHVTLSSAAGTLLARPTACFSCLEDTSRLCQACALLPTSYPKVSLPHGRRRQAQ